MSLNNQQNDVLTVKVADKEKCPCAKCKWGILFGGWNESWCVKYTDNKPSSILFDNQECPHFKTTQGKNHFEKFSK